MGARGLAIPAIVALGVLVVVGLAVLARAAARGTGDIMRSDRVGGLRGNALLAGKQALGPAASLAVAWAVAAALALRHDGRGAVWATILVMLAGRMALATALWRALRIGPMMRRAMGFAARRRNFVGLLLALSVGLPLLLRGVSVGATGDEPSYMLYAASFLQDGNFDVRGGELAKAVGELNLPPASTAHTWPFREPNPPLHFIGISVVLAPIYFVGRLVGSIWGTAHAFVLATYGLSIFLTGLLAARLSNRRGESLLATALLALSFPMLPQCYQIYPECVATPLVLASYLWMAPTLLGERALSARRAAAVLAVAVALPWFHVKFGALSAILGALAAWTGHPWTPKRAAACLGLVAAGAAGYFAFHITLYGPMLYKQSQVGWNPTGILGLLTNSDSGMLPYLPWIVCLPAGLAALRRRGGDWVLPLALAAPGVAFYILPVNNSCWNSGGDTPLRFFHPACGLWAPMMAAWLGRRGTVRLPVFALLASVSLAAAAVFLRDPWTAYGVEGGQCTRTVLDFAFGGFSWRELFPTFAYGNVGCDVPLRFGHGMAVVAVAVGVAAVMSRRGRPWPLRSAGGPACLLVTAVALLAGASLCFDSPNWEMTGLRMFASQTLQLAATGRGTKAAADRPAATLDLLAAVKPCEGMPRVATGTSLAFPAKGIGSLLMEVAVPGLAPGHYRMRAFGSAAAPNDADGPFFLVVERGSGDGHRFQDLGTSNTRHASVGLAQGALAETRCNLLPSNAETGGTNLRLRLFRNAEVQCTIDRIQIQYMGR